MVETPRAALTAGAVAEESEFFSFGTNDLTQMTYGFSRDDAEGKFLRNYINEGVLPADPFASIDRDGVGELVRLAVNAGRKVARSWNRHLRRAWRRPVQRGLLPRAGLDYVSCSPFRVPVARLAAAQAALGMVKPIFDAKAQRRKGLVLVLGEALLMNRGLLVMGRWRLLRWRSYCCVRV